MYRKKPWTLNDPVTGVAVKEKETGVKALSEEEAVIEYLKEHSNSGITSRTVSSLFNAGIPKGQILIRSLLAKGLIKLTGYKRRGPNLLGIYHLQNSSVPELNIIKDKTGYTSVTSFIKENKVSVETSRELKKVLKEKCTNHCFYLLQGRIIEVHPKELLRNALQEVTSGKRDPKKRTEAPEVEQIPFKFSKGREEIKEEIINFLKEDSLSLRKKSTIASYFYRKEELSSFLYNEIMQGIKELEKDNEIKSTKCKDGNRTLELYQVTDSPVWTNPLVKSPDTLDFSDFMYLNEFSLKYLYKNSVSYWNLKKGVETVKLISISGIARNGKIAKFYYVEDLKKLFNEHVKASRKSVNIVKEKSSQSESNPAYEGNTLQPAKKGFSFKFFGKEITIQIS